MPPLGWAVLVYSSASPDIEPAADASVAEIARAPLADGVGVAVQYGTAHGVRRTVRSGASRVETESPAADMADPTTLQDFLAWGMRALPARHYVVVLGGHGGGFMGVVEDAGRSHLMPPDGVANALRQASRKPDVLVMNACLMAQAEFADEMAPHAAILVGSQGREEGAGIPLGAALATLTPATTDREAAEALVRAAAGAPQRTATLSALDLAEAPRLERALDGLGRAILAAPAARERLLGHVRATRGFYDFHPWDHPLSDMKDLVDFAGRLSADPSLEASGIAAAARVVEVVGAHMVIANEASTPASGLSIYLPAEDLGRTHGEPGRRVEDIYHSLRLPRDTAWGRAVAVLAR